MRWAEISVEAGAASEDAVANILIEEGCGGTVILSGAKNLDPDAEILRVAQNDNAVSDNAVNDNAVIVAGYLPVDDRLEGRLEAIRKRVRSLPELGLPITSSEIGIKWVQDDDWATAYRSFFKPIRLGRVVVRPSWEGEAPAEPGQDVPGTPVQDTDVLDDRESVDVLDDQDARADEIVVEIDPGMAFGTGHHASTRLCLLALQDHIRGGETVLDVGTGSGILAIAAAKLGAARVVGIDIDPVAARIAAENVEMNGLAAAIRILTADSPLVFDGLADIVLANIVPNVILAMAADLCARLRPGGKLITSGIIPERADEVKAALESLGLATIEQRADEDWVALVSERVESGESRVESPSPARPCIGANCPPMHSRAGGHRRFFIDPNRIEGDTAEITGDTARQIVRVLRLKKGDSICLVDGRGTELDARIIALSAGSVTARISGSRHCDAEPKLGLSLAVCLPKGDKIELIVQKCTELGISELVVVSSQRTVARIPAEKTQTKLARWRKIAREAAEQCGRATAPGVEGVLNIGDLAELIPTVPLALVACEGPDAPPLKDVLRENAAAGSLMVIIGPEGGLTDDEARLVVEAGAVPVSLGKRILRCETAAIAACAAVMYELEGEL